MPRVLYCSLQDTIGGTALPLYEYKCLKCGKKTEKIESVSGPFLKKCPHCGGKVERVQSAPAIQFKGSGWYVTDYAGKTGAKETGSSDSASASAEKSDKTDKSEKSDKKDSSEKESSTKESTTKETKEKKPASKK
jgi:putative FmdB family regulatory protein